MCTEIHLIKKKIVLDDPLWKKIEKNYKVASSTQIKSVPTDFYHLLGFLKKAPIKTEIAYLGRVNRQKLAELRYSNNNNFYSKKLPENKFYIINNRGHLNHLKILFENKNVGFVLRDNIWLLLPNLKSLMNKNDKNELVKVEITKIFKNKKIVFKNANFINKSGIFGLGWSYNVAEQSLWSDGQRSSIIFKPEKNIEKFKLILDVEAYIRPKNKVQEVNIFVNGIFEKKIIFDESLKRNKFLDIEIKNSNKNFVLVEFYITNPKSPFDILESVDARKKGIKINSLILSEK